MAKKRILLIENDPDHCEVMEKEVFNNEQLLKHYATSIKCFSFSESGRLTRETIKQEILEFLHAQQDNFDILLMDLVLTDECGTKPLGLELILSLKGTYQQDYLVDNPPKKAIAFTGMNGKELNIVRNAKVDYIRKPDFKESFRDRHGWYECDGKERKESRKHSPIPCNNETNNCTPKDNLICSLLLHHS